MQVTLFKHSFGSFIDELNEAGLKYSVEMQRSMQPQNAGQIVEIVESISDAMPWSVLAKVIEKWIKARASREVIITTEDNQIIHAKGYSAVDMQRILATARAVEIIETKPEK